MWLPVAVRTRSVKAAEPPEVLRGRVRPALPRGPGLHPIIAVHGLAASGGQCADLGRGRPGRPRHPAASRARQGGPELDLPMSDFVFDLLSARRALGDARWVFPAPSASGHIEEPKFPSPSWAGDGNKRLGPRHAAPDLRHRCRGRRHLAAGAEGPGQSRPWKRRDGGLRSDDGREAEGDRPNAWPTSSRGCADTPAPEAPPRYNS